MDLAAFQVEEERVMQGGEIRDLLALYTVVIDGTLRVEYLGSDGAILAASEHGIRGLLDKEIVRIPLPIENHPNISQIRLRF